MEQNLHRDALADAIGDFIEYWGFRSIHGRIWAVIFLAQKPLSASEIVTNLNVSKGLVSIALKELADHGLIEKSERVEYGRQTFVSQENIGTIIRGILRRRELSLLTNAESSIDSLLAHSDQELDGLNIDRRKLQQLEKLTKSNKAFLLAVVGQSFDTICAWQKLFYRIANFIRM